MEIVSVCFHPWLIILRNQPLSPRCHSWYLRALNTGEKCGSFVPPEVDRWQKFQSTLRDITSLAVPLLHGQAVIAKAKINFFQTCHPHVARTAMLVLRRQLAACELLPVLIKLTHMPYWKFRLQTVIMWDGMMMMMPHLHFSLVWLAFIIISTCTALRTTTPINSHQLLK